MPLVETFFLIQNVPFIKREILVNKHKKLYLLCKLVNILFESKPRGTFLIESILNALNDNSRYIKRHFSSLCKFKNILQLIRYR